MNQPTNLTGRQGADIHFAYWNYNYLTRTNFLYNTMIMNFKIILNYTVVLKCNFFNIFHLCVSERKWELGL